MKTLVLDSLLMVSPFMSETEGNQESEGFDEGGVGSGNYDHAGRPGEVGGSAKGTRHGLPKKKWESPPPPGKGRDPSIKGGMTSIKMTNTQLGDMGEMLLVREAGMKSIIPKGQRQNPLDVKWNGSNYAYEVKAVTTQSKEYKIKMKSYEVDSKLRYAKSQGYTPGMIMLVIDRKSGIARAYRREGIGNFRLTNESDWTFMGKIDVTKEDWKYRKPKKKKEDFEEGGAGSGNFGHAGRPGEVGGSASDGSASRATTKRAARTKTSAEQKASVRVHLQSVRGSFPTVDSICKRRLRSVKYTRFDDEGQMGLARYGGSEIELSDDFPWDTDDVLHVGEKEFHIASNTPETVMRHELGHVVENAVVDMNGERQSPAREKWFSIAVKGSRGSKLRVRKDVSMYGASMVTELFAEAFAAYTHPRYGRGKNARLPKDIEEFMVQYIGRPQSSRREGEAMLAEPNCSKRNCVHFTGVKNDGDESTERVVCEAFPDGIPDEIAYGDNDHTEPFKGDNGIQFKESTDECDAENE